MAPRERHARRRRPRLHAEPGRLPAPRARVRARRRRARSTASTTPGSRRVHGNAARLARFCDAVRARRAPRRVDLVAHSLGGLVAMEYLHDAGARTRVRRLVTIASPHAGVAWRGPILGACGPQLRGGMRLPGRARERAVPVPCLSVYSTHDNVVHPPRDLDARGARRARSGGRARRAPGDPVRPARGRHRGRVPGGAGQRDGLRRRTVNRFARASARALEGVAPPAQARPRPARPRRAR